MPVWFKLIEESVNRHPFTKRTRNKGSFDENPMNNSLPISRQPVFSRGYSVSLGMGRKGSTNYSQQFGGVSNAKFQSDSMEKVGASDQRPHDGRGKGSSRHPMPIAGWHEPLGQLENRNWLRSTNSQGNRIDQRLGLFDGESSPGWVNSIFQLDGEDYDCMPSSKQSSVTACGCHIRKHFILKIFSLHE
jgi:hypothetical protein